MLETSPGPGTLEAVIDRIETALDAAVAFDVTVPDGGELGAAVVASQRLRAKFAAMEAKLVGRFDTSRTYRADGSRSAAAWIAARTNTPKNVLQATVTRARRLRHMPATSKAMADGRLAPERADVLSREAARSGPVGDAFVDDEAELVESATSKRFEDFRRDVGYWRDRVDPDDADNRARKLHDSRRVHLSESFEGQWFLDGLLDPIGGGELAEALRRICVQFHRDDRRAAEAEHGAGCAEDLLPRTPAQRRADALVELARRGMAAAPGSRKPVPLISILVGYETFRGPVCETFNGTKLAPSQVAAHLTEADIERVVFAPGGRDITDLGRKSRFFSAAQRRVVEIRDGTCWHPDCDVSAEHCDMDHAPTPWANGGESNLTNARAGCDLHNRITQTTGKHPHPPDDPDPPSRHDLPSSPGRGTDDGRSPASAPTAGLDDPADSGGPDDDHRGSSFAPPPRPGGPESEAPDHG